MAPWALSLFVSSWNACRLPLSVVWVDRTAWWKGVLGELRGESSPKPTPSSWLWVEWVGLCSEQWWGKNNMAWLPGCDYCQSPSGWEESCPTLQNSYKFRTVILVFIFLL